MKGSIQGFKSICLRGIHIESKWISGKLMSVGQESNVSSTTIYQMIQACIDHKKLDMGRVVHSYVVSSCREGDPFLGSHLIRMYSLGGSLSEADSVFWYVSDPNVFTWTAIIYAYETLGNSEAVIRLFSKIPWIMDPGERIYVATLKACSVIGGLEQGNLVHGCILESGQDICIAVSNTLINMYALFGCIQDAHQLFKGMTKPSTVTWNVMIAGYLTHGDGWSALQIYYQMWQDGRFEPDTATMVSVLKACSIILAFDLGNVIFGYIVEQRASMDVNVVNTVIDLFAKCGHLLDAAWVFDMATKRDTVTWSVIIAGYVQNGYSTVAMQLFGCMLRECLEPDVVTFATLLKATLNLDNSFEGMLLHSYVVSAGEEKDVFIVSGLVDMYAKSGNLNDAKRVFERSTKHNVVTWSALMTGYGQLGYTKDVLQLFAQMLQNKIIASSTTFVCVLAACAEGSFLSDGMIVHSYIISTGHEVDESVESALVNMYMKCGTLVDANFMFDRSLKQTVSAWTSLISGYTQHYDYDSVLQSFKKMQNEGIKPNTVTFVSLLSACSHVGATDDERFVLNFISDNELVFQTQEQFNCLTDLLGRVGWLECAEVNLLTQPFEPGFCAWVSLLTHCRIHGAVSLAKRCFDNAISLDDKHASVYTFMSKIYTDAGMFEDAQKIEQLKISLLVFNMRETAEFRAV